MNVNAANKTSRSAARPAPIGSSPVSPTAAQPINTGLQADRAPEGAFEGGNLGSRRCKRGAAPLTGAQVARVRELRYLDGLPAREVALRIGCSQRTIFRIAPGRPGKVPVAPAREAFLRSGLSANEVARRMGWTHSDSVPDGVKVKRLLGLIDDISGKGVRSRRVVADAEKLARCADAIGVEPWEVLPSDPDEAVA